MNLLEQINREQVEKLAAARPVPEFQPGDTVRVMVRVVEGERERVQAFEGVCIARRNADVNSSFTLRKISYGEGVERVFPLHSPRITAIEVLARGWPQEAEVVVPALLAAGEKPEIETAAVRAVARAGRPTLAAKVISLWAGLDLAIRRELLAALLGSSVLAKELLVALEGQTISPSELVWVRNTR